MSVVIAEYKIVGHQSDGVRFPVRVVMYQPEPSADASPAWQCKVTVEPLWTKPFVIYGEGSFQALCLAAKHAVQMLHTFAEQGGVLEYPDGDSFEAESFGFALSRRSA